MRYDSLQFPILLTLASETLIAFMRMPFTCQNVVISHIKVSRLIIKQVLASAQCMITGTVIDSSIDFNTCISTYDMNIPVLKNGSMQFIYKTKRSPLTRCKYPK